MDTDVSVTAIWWVSSEWSKMARNDKTICPLQKFLAFAAFEQFEF